MLEINFENKAVGCLMGLAVGDALGAPLEGASPKAIRSRFGQVVDYLSVDLVPNKARMMGWCGPGLYTDDTQQALVLADTMLQHNCVDPEIIADWYVRLSKYGNGRFGVYRGTGRNFRESVSALESGAPWYEAGTNTAGNGAAMRIAPVALFYHNDPKELAHAVVRASLITHRNLMGLSSALAVARLVTQLLHASPENPPQAEELLQDTYEYCVSGEDMLLKEYGKHLFHDSFVQKYGFSTALWYLKGKFDLEPDVVIQGISENAQKFTSGRITRATTGFAAASVIFSIYMTLKNLGSFERAVIETINMGGDADTTGAMTGSLAGALHGVSAIPSQWISGLANSEAIMARGRALALRQQCPMRVQDLARMEDALVSTDPQQYRANKDEPGSGKIKNKAMPYNRRAQGKKLQRHLEELDS